ncbi:ABC transporter ATP-binding protein [Salisaeta longa]|uniref:ABC transporter ATP-binding protein n=1 Tax=Salisaeta longa TaxID=503170 RepID=UPI0003B3CD69|nr:ATP-binding cassette domain-containing protein [Salisaeta longa]
MLTLSDGGRLLDDAWIWRGLSLTVDAGTRWAVVGPSGAGKTVLLRALAGLDRLDEGAITFQARALSDWSLPAYRAAVTYVPQAPAFVEGTVADNLRVPFSFAVHRDRSYDPARVMAYLEQLDQAEDFLERPVDALSGGERQIAALLRALQLAPTILLLDEPTANVDAARTQQIEALVNRWMDSADEAAFVWTSHDADQVERMTDRALTLPDGTIQDPSATATVHD